MGKRAEVHTQSLCLLPGFPPESCAAGGVLIPTQRIGRVVEPTSANFRYDVAHPRAGSYLLAEPHLKKPRNGLVLQKIEIGPDCTPGRRIDDWPNRVEMIGAIAFRVPNYYPWHGGRDSIFRFDEIECLDQLSLGELVAGTDFCVDEIAASSGVRAAR